MYKGFSLFYGIFFIMLGVFGFLPFFIDEGCLFDTFKVNEASNIIHISTGIVGIWMFFAQGYYQRIYFQIVGFIYAIFSIFGFIYGKAPVLGFIANNPPMTWLHVIFAVLALVLGFGNHLRLENRKKDE